MATAQLDEPRCFAAGKPETPPASGRDQRVAIADALRSAAILLVLANHLAIGAAITVGGHRADYAFLGVIGVDCFLVLSGFLLGGPYVGALLGERPFPSTRLFLTRRFFRIYPLYAFAVLPTGITAWGTGSLRDERVERGS